MKKLVVLVAILALAPAAFAQLSYVPPTYTGDNTPRLTPDSKLGVHDVMLSKAGFGSIGADQELAGCQGCHVPHEAANELYIWKWDIPTNINDREGNPIALDSASFHTLACLSCHDGVTAADVVANLPGGVFPAWAAVASDAEGLMNDHPVNEMLTQRGSTAPTLSFVRLYTPSGYTLQVNGENGYTGATELGLVECGSCHDPHKGQSTNYAFLRYPKTATGATPQFARLAFCRDCHGK
jgi:hypothetical protein